MEEVTETMEKETDTMNEYDLIITPQKSLLQLNLKKVWQYKDLLFLFVKRDFVAVYKQTIFGPLWFFIQPILTTITFTVVFGNIAEISTDGMPKVIFYLSGITMWNYFSDCVNKTSATFTANQHIFGKVYFPRVIVPLSIVMTNLLKFGVQILLFVGFYLYYYFTEDSIHPNLTIFLFPLLVVFMATMSLGIGMLISSMTTKYRDLTFLVGFGIQLMMYASPIIYPMNEVGDKYKIFIELNPMSGIINNFKYGTLGSGEFDWFGLIYGFVFSLVILMIGTLVFNRVEKSFIDTV